MPISRPARSRGRRAFHVPLGLLAVAASAACGAAPAPLQAPAVPAAQAVAPPPAAPDLRAVPDPPSLVVSGRVNRPSAILATARVWSRLPMWQSDEVTELALGDAAGALVDLDQPIDFALSVVGTGMHVRDRSAVSLGLKDIERAKSLLTEHFKLVAGDDGALVIHGLGHARHGSDDDVDLDVDEERGEEDRRSCEIAPAYGASPARLVCAWGPKALPELAPWLLRTATRATSTSDAHLDLRMAPLRAALSGQKRLLGSVLSTALGTRIELPSALELASSVCSDLVDFALDLDSLSLDFAVTDPGAAATATLKFASATSSLARLATAHPDRNGPPPDAFLALPADADFALFDRGVDETDMARARDLLLRLLDDGLGEYGLKEGDRKPILDAFAKMASSAGMVYASGLDLDGATKALAAIKPLRDGPDSAPLVEAQRAAAEALLGWRLLAIDEPPARWADALKDLAVAVARPAFAATYRAKIKGGSPPSLRLAPLPKATALPAGSVHYVLDLYPTDALAAAASSAAGSPPAGGKPKGPPPAKKPVTLQIFVVPDGARSWLALGGGEASVSAKVAAAITSAGEKVAARPELAALKGGSTGAGGFFTLRSLAEAAPQLQAFLGATHRATEGLDEIAPLPHRGGTPVPFSVTARGDGPATAGPPPVTIAIAVARDVVEDVVAAALRHGGF